MGFLDNVKQAMQMRGEAKKMQAAMESLTAEYSNGGITVVAKGDLSVSSIAIAPETWEEVCKGKKDRFETMLFNVVNGALKNARRKAQEQVMEQMKSGGLQGLFGKQ